MTHNHAIKTILWAVSLVLTTTLFAQTPASTGYEPLESYQETPPEVLRRSITLQADQMPLEEVLREIGRQAELVVVFNTDLAAAVQPRSLELKDIPALEAFRMALEGTGLQGYWMPEGKVLITRTPAEEARPQQAVRGQTIRGQVLDKDSQYPLPGVNIVVLHSNPLIGTATDTDGRFTLTNVPLGRHDVQFSFIGYEPVILPEVLVTAGKELVLNMTLKEQIIVGEEIVVVPTVQKDQPLNDMAIISARSFSVEETRRYAGSVDDPARMAAAFAGVTSGDFEENSLIIRGNAPKGVQWRLEGVEIPSPNHFAGLNVVGGGALTIFSSQMLDNSDFFTGAFPGEYGNALAGVFDMNLRLGNATRREHAAQVGVMGVEVASEGPFVKGKSATYLFNYRYATLALLAPLLPTRGLPKYQDLSFKVGVPTGVGRFEFWGMGGLDDQDIPPVEDAGDWKYEFDRSSYQLNMGIGATGVKHSLALGRNSFLQTTLAATANRTEWELRQLDAGFELQDNMKVKSYNGRLVLGSFLNHKFNPRHVNRTGLSLQRLYYDLDFQYAPNDTPPLVPIVSGKGNSSLIQFYTQSKFNLSSRLVMNAGLHAQRFALTEKYSVEPRLSLRWQFLGNQAFSFGYGLHSQIEEMRIYFVEQQTPGGSIFPNERLDFARAHHGVVGYDLQLGAAARFKIEAYYQSLFNVPVIADSSYSMLNFEQDWTFNEALVNTGTGRNYGLDLTVERFLKDGYYYLVTGSVFKSEYKGGDRVLRNTRFDRTFAANALFGKEFMLGSAGDNVLGVNFRATVMGGKRYSPIDVEASEARQEVVFDEARAFEAKEPAVFLLDATVTYRINRRGLSHVLALQVKNILGSSNFFYEYNIQTGTVEEVREMVILPVLSYKIEF